MKTITWHLLIFILFMSCSDRNNNDDENENINRTYISKVTITDGPNGYNPDVRTRTYKLNYDLNKKLTSIATSDSFYGYSSPNPSLVTLSATYNIEYENGQIIRVYTDCKTNDCDLNLPGNSNFEGTYQIYFKYGIENGYKSVNAYKQVLDHKDSIISSYEIEQYLLLPNNLVKRVEGHTEIIYSNNNAIGVQNASAYNKGLKYLNYDDKKSVVIYTDYTHIIDRGDYFPRLILDLKYSKNNYTKLDFGFRDQHQIIDFSYDFKDRPTKRTVFNNGSFDYEEIFEYLD